MKFALTPGRQCLRALLVVCLLAMATQAFAANTDAKGNYCGIEGNWIQILGSGNGAAL